MDLPKRINSFDIIWTVHRDKFGYKNQQDVVKVKVKRSRRLKGGVDL